jgi:hypothetical protein
MCMLASPWSPHVHSLASTDAATPLPPILSWSSFISSEALPFQSGATVRKALDALAATVGSDLESGEFATKVDVLDPLAVFRSQFCVPRAHAWNRLRARQT